jgi:hypothetical protein
MTVYGRAMFETLGEKIGFAIITVGFVLALILELGHP